MKTLTRFAVGLAITMAVLSLFEAFSIHPIYVLESATVRKVVRNPSWHYIGADEMTLIRFDDGFATDTAGNRGEPGDRVLVWRERGSASLLGILGDKSMFTSTH